MVVSIINTIGIWCLISNAFISVIYFVMVEERYPKYKNFKSLKDIILTFILTYLYLYLAFQFNIKLIFVELNFIEEILLMLIEFNLFLRPLLMITINVSRNRDAWDNIFPNGTILLYIIYNLTPIIFGILYVFMIF